MSKSALSKHLSRIGKLGGKKRANDPDRFILAKEAARISWMPQAAAKRAATIALRKHDAGVTKS